jgi:hypothetical protein
MTEPPPPEAVTDREAGGLDEQTDEVVERAIASVLEQVPASADDDVLTEGSGKLQPWAETAAPSGRNKRPLEELIAEFAARVAADPGARAKQPHTKHPALAFLEKFRPGGAGGHTGGGRASSDVGERGSSPGRRTGRRRGNRSGGSGAQSSGAGRPAAHRPAPLPGDGQAAGPRTDSAGQQRPGRPGESPRPRRRGRGRGTGGGAGASGGNVPGGQPPATARHSGDGRQGAGPEGDATRRGPQGGGRRRRGGRGRGRGGGGGAGAGTGAGGGAPSPA